MLGQVDIAIDEDGGDEDIGEVVDHQVQGGTVEIRQHGAGLHPPGEGAVETVHEEGRAQPEQAIAGLVIEQGEYGHQRQHDACGSDAVSGPGLGFVDYVDVGGHEAALL
ncbi:hypothetical protein D3C76_966740 [compost metagenome]